jgi:2-polyprenyl-3-methyl-5-hydroxy-6-metoxy-1,4-benzoquinol methylase/spore coat polysaccharide biosynthesis predicted glycosyltransferase SpsG
MSAVERVANILVAASFEKGRGSGHLVRSAALVRDLRLAGRAAFLHLCCTGRTVEEARQFFARIEHFDEAWLITGAALAETRFAFIVLDRFATPPEEAAHWASRAPVIAIDEGGPCRARFDFLLDLLPAPYEHPANDCRPDLLSLPVKGKRAHADEAVLKLLVSFGGEDAEGLGLPAAKALVSGETAVTLVRPALAPEAAPLRAVSGVTVIDPVPSLRDRLGEYGLVITHFGLTAFEALYAGVPVILVSPTKLHEKLAVHAGFFSAGIGKQAALSLHSLLLGNETKVFGLDVSLVHPKAPELNREAFAALAGRCARVAARWGLDKPARQTLSGYIATLRVFPSGASSEMGGVASRAVSDTRRVFPPGSCFEMGGIASRAVNTLRVIARFPRRSYWRCSGCGIIYMNRLGPAPIAYSERYFFEDYKNQYGKTYLEDFPSLKKTGAKRLEAITPLLSPSPQRRSLLDIGCAYGPFLAAAREAGFEACGLDTAASAVEYVRGTLGLPAYNACFPTEIPAEIAARMFDIITLWYVIEHFTDGGTALKKAAALLRSGGVLAFSTPNIAGISGRLNLRRFLEASPADHWTVWDPRKTKNLLRRFGLSVKKIIITGHHPERFPFAGKLVKKKRGFIYTMLLLISRIFKLGDTFEVYAVKE